MNRFYYNAFLGVLSTVRRSEIKDMLVSSALKGLDEEARAIDIEQDNNTAFQRGRQFYTMLQYIQDSPFQGMGLLRQEEIDAISKLQKKKDASVTANFQGRECNRSFLYAEAPKGSPDILWRSAQIAET